MKTLKLLLFLVCLSFGLHAQYAATKLRLVGKEVLEIFESDVQIDTLIMDDKSRIVFKMPDTKLVIKNAFIGKHCTWDLSGKSGEPTSDVSPVGAGLPGRNLQAEVVFRYLADLRIDATGAIGRKSGGEVTFTYGDVIKQGGDGGDGGIVSLAYGTSGFPIEFNTGSFRSIEVNVEGGHGGLGEDRHMIQPVYTGATARGNSHNALIDGTGNHVTPSAYAGDRLPTKRADWGSATDIPVAISIQNGVGKGSNASSAYNATNVQTQPVQNHLRPSKSKYAGLSGLPGQDGSFTKQEIH